MTGTCVDRRRLIWVVLVGLSLIALMIPSGAAAASRGARTKATVTHTRTAAGAARHARHYIAFGRKVGVAVG